MPITSPAAATRYTNVTPSVVHLSRVAKLVEQPVEGLSARGVVRPYGPEGGSHMGIASGCLLDLVPVRIAMIAKEGLQITGTEITEEVFRCGLDDAAKQSPGDFRVTAEDCVEQVRRHIATPYLGEALRDVRLLGHGDVVCDRRHPGQVGESDGAQRRPRARRSPLPDVEVGLIPVSVDDRLLDCRVTGAQPDGDDVVASAMSTYAHAQGIVDVLDPRRRRSVVGVERLVGFGRSHYPAVRFALAEVQVLCASGAEVAQNDDGPLLVFGRPNDVGPPLERRLSRKDRVLWRRAGPVHTDDDALTVSGARAPPLLRALPSHPSVGQSRFHSSDGNG